MIKSTLRPYQKIAYNKCLSVLLDEFYFALFLEMGLGKTLVSLCAADYLLSQNLIDDFLIICPKSLIRNWEKEIEKHSDGLRYSILNIEKLSRSFEKHKHLSDGNVFVVLDESTFIKTHKAKRTKNAIELADRCKFRMIMTGTEIESGVLGLYSQFQFLSKKFWKQFRNYFSFRYRYAVLKEIYIRNKSVKTVVGYQNLSELRKKIAPYSITQTKAQCLPDLPDKVWTVLTVSMSAEQKKIYTQFKNEAWAEYKDSLVTAPSPIALFTRFRQIAAGFFPESNECLSDAKYKVFREMELSKKALIWSCFRPQIERLRKEPDFCAFYGGVKEEELFRNEKQFMAINPSSGAFGLNLQYSDISIFFSLTLSPEKWAQLQDRQHRSGQKNTVNYYPIITEGTIEEKIYVSHVENKDFVEKFRNNIFEGV